VYYFSIVLKSFGCIVLISFWGAATSHTFDDIFYLKLLSNNFLKFFLGLTCLLPVFTFLICFSKCGGIRTRIYKLLAFIFANLLVYHLNANMFFLPVKRVEVKSFVSMAKEYELHKALKFRFRVKERKENKSIFLLNNKVSELEIEKLKDRLE
jgi:hypothetical protein